MKNKLKKTAVSLLVVVFWVGVWDVAAFLVKRPLLLPSPRATGEALITLLGTGEFYSVVLATLLRVTLGLVLGIVLGIVVAILCHRFFLVKTILSPIISVIRSTPVASFIVLLWVMLDGNMLTITVAFLMVMPIVWQNTLDGFASIPKELVEVAQVYELSLKRRYEILVFPVLSRYIFPAIITSVGLAWKSEVAAEIIAYTKDSIGMHINDAKSLLLTESVFAWTIVIIVTSICLEMLLKKLLGRGNK